MGAASCAYVRHGGDGELRWMGETSTYFLATGETTRGAFALVDERAKRGESVPLHLHRDDMESFYVVEGEITLFIGDQPGVRSGVARSRTFRVGRCMASESSPRPPGT